MERTPVHEAAQRGETLQLQRLIESGACVNQVTVDSITPLHAASLQGQARCVQLLLAAGAQVSGPAGQTPARAGGATAPALENAGRERKETRDLGLALSCANAWEVEKALEGKRKPEWAAVEASGGAACRSAVRGGPVGHGSAIRRALVAREKAVVGGERQGARQSRPAHHTGRRKSCRWGPGDVGVECW